MARQQQAAEFDYDSAAKSRELFEKSYLNVEVTEAEVRHADDGRAIFHFAGVVCGPHRDGTDRYDGHPVYKDWYIGTEDDPEAEDPKTWATTDKAGLDDEQKGFAFSHDRDVASLIQCLKAAKLTKGTGKGVPPWELFPDLEGEVVCINFGEGTSKKTGKSYQTMTFYAKGERDPQLLGRAAGAAPRRREPEEAPTRRGPRAVEPEAVEEEEERPRRRARA